MLIGAQESSSIFFREREKTWSCHIERLLSQVLEEHRVAGNSSENCEREGYWTLSTCDPCSGGIFLSRTSKSFTILCARVQSQNSRRILLKGRRKC
mmetsp:Transcript_36747/g.146998  ORF Transcript_36747/g.146998 Transcript_36747/m.146998 type:complete len:96 (+) Transcript_36747:47-334(+)